MSHSANFTSLSSRNSETPYRRWPPLIGVGLSLALHGLAWLAWLNRQPDEEPVVTPPQVIEVALMTEKAPAVEPASQTQVQSPPKPQPEPPPPKRPAPPKPKPKAKPVARPEPPPISPQHSEAEAPSAPVVSAPEAPPKPAAPPPAPYVEASYKGPGLHNPPTRYPRIALERQWEGSVQLKVQVLTDGTAGEIRVERSSGHEILDEATIEQVKSWRFIPARRGDQAVISWVIVPIEYKLKH
ncbi:energy transducer TonB [Methylococcus sp. EFPC2]|uniref:energy transducer TonB n=1 Tax=Methylococcus sp. EFPC2 TaxID=2812648 RepID=UPI0019683923|nr:energy transducer TonB [Methylococcus sp. EFPC2]QSA97599.1 energy transducer TonB [Methylococcus sp. EFPC2]